MSTKECLVKMIDQLPEERLRELVDFAAFLSWQDERDDWRHFGRAQFAQAFGPDEPEYSQDDLKPEAGS